MSAGRFTHKTRFWVPGNLRVHCWVVLYYARRFCHSEKVSKNTLGENPTSKSMGLHLAGSGLSSLCLTGRIAWARFPQLSATQRLWQWNFCRLTLLVVFILSLCPLSPTAMGLSSYSTMTFCFQGASKVYFLMCIQYKDMSTMYFLNLDLIGQQENRIQTRLYWRPEFCKGVEGGVVLQVRNNVHANRDCIRLPILVSGAPSCKFPTLPGIQTESLVSLIPSNQIHPPVV